MIDPAPNFVWRDFLRSREHPDLELELDDVVPAWWINAMRVMLLSLQPYRDFAGRLGVLSFIRSRTLSEAIPGAKIGGDHETGLAADFKTLDMAAADFFEAVERGDVPRATWDKLNIYTRPATFHVAHRPLELGAPRRRIYRDWERIG
jgi:hypothetical protein